MMYPKLSSAMPTGVARAVGSCLLLAMAIVSGCFEQGTRERYEPILPPPDPVEEPTAVADPPGSDPVTPPAEEYLDAGPLQFRIVWDGSTVPTSEYVRGVDAAAGEAERGLADDPEIDAGTDGG
jgi:hypothetical protein